MRRRSIRRLVSKPAEAISLDTRKFILPSLNLWHNDYLGPGGEIDDVSRRLLGRAEIQSKGPTIGKMLVTRAPGRRSRQMHATQAPKGIDVGQIRLGARQQLIRRLPPSGRARQAVAQPCRHLHGKRMEGRWKVGGGEEHTCKAKD